MNKRKFLPFSIAIAGLALAPPIASATANPTPSQLPPAQHAGAVTWLNGGAQAPQAEAPARFPLGPRGQRIRDLEGRLGDQQRRGTYASQG